VLYITSEEKAYIAGIIDGEGSIMLIRFHKNQFPSPCVSISSTTLELLEWIKNKTNVGNIISKKNYDPNKHKNSYTYIVKYRNAIKFIEYIEPYLVIESKRKRAQLILNEYESVTPRNGRYSDEALKLKEEFYERFISIK
jgi:hypothetical protein